MSQLRQKIQLLPVLRFVWQSSAAWSLVRIVLVGLQGVLPLALLYVLKLVIDQISSALASTRGVADLQSVYVVLLVYAALTLLNHAVNVASEVVNTAQTQRVTDYMQNMLLEKSVAADLAYYENPDYYDTLQRAQQEAPYRPSQLLLHLVQLGQSSILLIGVMGLLISLHWVLGMVLVVSALPAFLIRVRFARVLFRWRRRRTALEREAAYLGLVLTSDTYAKEVRLFGIGDWIRARFRQLRLRLYRETLQIVMRRSLANFAAQFVSTALTVFVFGFIAYNTLQGRLQIGDLVLYQQALQRGETALSTLLKALSGLYEDNLFVTNLNEFLSLTPTIVDPSRPQQQTGPIRQGIEFRNVSFQYAGTTRKALHDINLTIPAGQTVALVGENGSGKTTLIKLLCRLYDPTDGEILIDQQPLQNFKVSDLRRRISVIFQDYGKYPFTALENIWLGNLSLDRDDPKIKLAARKARADRVIESLPQQYDSVLGKLFKAGEELSVGQWQKIALARAFVRESEIIVLDEPTSAMDPKAEYEVFQHFKALIDGQTAILISHRMSTVRMADYIFVVDQGKIIEDGTHESLMLQNGSYARMFNLQAKKYL